MVYCTRVKIDGVTTMDDYLNDDLLDMFDEMMEEEENVLDLFSLSKMPDATDLRSLLDCYTKEILFLLAEVNGVVVRKSWLKERLVNELYEHILDTIDERLLFMSDRDVELIKKFMLDEMVMSEEDVDTIEFYGRVFPTLIQLGLLFFRDTTDDFHVFTVRELADGLQDLEDLREKNPEKMKFAQRGGAVLKAGVNLYGVIDVSRFIDLYTIADSTFEDTIDQLGYIIKVLPILALSHNFLVVNPLLIASDEFMDSEDIQDFHFSIFEKLGENYYEPSQKEIEYFANHSFDRTLDGYKALKRLCEKVSEVDSDFLMDRIEYHIRLGDRITDTLDMLEFMGLIEFRYEKQMERFATLFSQVSNHSRMWVNAGYTPVELSEGYI